MEHIILLPHIENILKERYYLSNETSWTQLSKRMSSIYPEMYEHILTRQFIPSTPTLMNLNTKGERRGTLSSCFILGIEDSIDGIMESMKECAIVTKMAGGVGYNFSNLRGSNENVKSLSANSGGVMPFVGIFDSVLDGVRQGGKRRGAGMSLLSIYHPDILKFLDAKAFDTKKYTRSNFSVIPDTLFYKTLKNTPDKIFKTKNVVDGKENELKDDDGLVYTYKMLWDKIIHNSWKSAEPGIFNGDIAIDRCSCKHISHNVFCNPCVSGDTEILTKNGYVDIKSNINKEIEIWNGFEWSNVIPKITGYNQPMLLIGLSDGRKLRCTHYHKWIISTNYQGGNKEKNAVDLKIGDRIIKNNFPIIEFKEEFKQAYTQGFISGDGMDDYNFLALYGPKFICEKRLSGKSNEYISQNINGTKRKIFNFDFLPYPKDFVPFNWNLESKINWLAGLFDSDGTELKEGGLQLVSINKGFLLELQKLLSLCGAQSKIVYGQPEGNRILPDGHGGEKEYLCKESWRICIGSTQIQELIKLGLKCERLSFDKSPNRDASQFVKIISIEDSGVEPEVYCFNEPKRHLGCFNGIVTGNCTEYVHLPYTSCNLGSINLSLLLDKNNEFDWVALKDLTEKATIYLNGIIDNNKYPIEKLKTETMAVRPIGLGEMGLAHLFYLLRIPYDSDEAFELTRKINKYMTLVSMNKSMELAKENKKTYKYYDYDVFMDANKRFFNKEKFMGIDLNELKSNIKKYGVYNSCFTSIAPTGTISYIADCSGGIEPVFGLVFTRKIEKENKSYEKVYLVDPIFEKYIEQHYLEIKNHIYEYISDNKGSCQGCKFLTKYEQNIFKVAGDITPNWHLRILSSAANNVSLSVSKTINLPQDCSKEEIGDVYLKAHEEGVIGVAVYRDGSREGILVHKEDDAQQFVKRRNAPKRPLDLECDIHEMNISIEGKKERLVALVGKLSGTVYEIFVTRDIKNKLDFNKHPKGIIRKIKKGKYDLIITNGEEKVYIEDISSVFSGPFGTLSRLVSMSLRHGTPLQIIIDQLQKNNISGFFEFDKCVARVLKKYIDNGEEVITSDICPNCSSNLIYVEGCKSCSNKECGWSKCS